MSTIRQSDAPILEGLRSFEKQNSTSFGVPGHKSGKGAPSDVKSLLGKYAFRGDATTQKGIDDRRMTKHVRQKAEQLAAQAWGAEHCYFATNGSSLSNHVAMAAAVNPGDTVLVARNSHKSVIAAAIMHNVRAVFLQPDYDETWDIYHGISATELEQKLAAHPDTRAVFIVSPTYYGVTSNIEQLAAVCHGRGIPLVVDEAWGPHYPFHPEMPRPAIQRGADLAVASVHKTMAGLEQASVVLLKSELVPFDRFDLAFDLFETTSPSVPILASIDASRRQFVEDGERLLGKLLDNARWVRRKLAAIPGVRVLGKEVINGDSRHGLEETKILFDIGDLGVNGWKAEDWLQSEHNVSFGLSDDRHLLAGFTVGNNGAAARKLVSSIEALAAWAKRDGDTTLGPPRDLPRKSDLQTELVMPPWEAFFAKAEHVPLGEAAGRVAAEMVSPYPPGIPRVLPGERITAAHIRYFEVGMRSGMFTLDPTDMSLGTLRVVA